MNRALKEIWDGSDHAYDPYGTAMQMGTCIAGIVWLWDPNEVPASWGYSPGGAGTAPPIEDQESWEWLQLISEFPVADPGIGEPVEGTWDAVTELVEFGNLLSRYIDFTKASGRAY